MSRDMQLGHQAPSAAYAYAIYHLQFSTPREAASRVHHALRSRDPRAESNDSSGNFGGSPKAPHIPQNLHPWWSKLRLADTNGGHVRTAVDIPADLHPEHNESGGSYQITLCRSYPQRSVILIAYVFSLRQSLCVDTICTHAHRSCQ